MTSFIGTTRGLVTACVAVATLGIAAPASADTSPDFDLTFPAGWACSFELRIEGWFGNTHRVERTFKEDKNGFVRSISAGIGSTLRYTNNSNLKSMTTKANGAVTRTTTYTQDGSQTWSLTGHNVLIMFPTDVPAGPSTTLYTGRVVFTVDPTYTTTVQSYSGKALDICAALM